MEDNKMHNNRTMKGLFRYSLLLLVLMLKPILVVLASPPVVTGSSNPTNNQNPTWNWSSSDGATVFRYVLKKDTTTQLVDTSSAVTYMPVAKLKAGRYTMFVKEKQTDGTWSANSYYVIRVDTTAPKIKSVLPFGGITNATNSSPFVAELIFTEEVSGFNSSAITAINGTIDVASFTQVNYKTYRVSVTPTSEGWVTIGVNAGVATDSANNYNKVSSNRIDYDITKPSVTGVSYSADKLYKKGDKIEVYVTFNRGVVVTGKPGVPLTVGDSIVQATFDSHLDVINGNKLKFVYSIPEDYLDLDGIDVTPLLSFNKGEAIKDSAGNSVDSVLSSVPSSKGIMVDAIIPKYNLAVTSVNDTVTNPIFFTIVFTKPVKMVDSTFMAISYANMTPTEPDADNKYYYNTDAELHPVIDSVSPVYIPGLDSAYARTYNFSLRFSTISGTLGFSLKGNAFTDSAGNGNLASVSPIVRAFDKYPPSVLSIVKLNTSTDTINLAEVKYRVTFSERTSGKIIGLDPADFNITSDSVTGIISAVIPSINDTTYDVTISGIKGNGDLRLDVKNDSSFSDKFGNKYFDGGFYSGEVYHFDFRPPTILSIDRLNPTTKTFSNANYASVKFKVVFSQIVSGVDASDFKVVTTGTFSGVGTVSVSSSSGSLRDRVWNVTVNKNIAFGGEGSIGIELSDAANVIDKAGNLCLNFSNGHFYTLDNKLPIPTLSIKDSATTAKSVPVYITFDEPVTDVTASSYFVSSVTLTNSTVAQTGGLPLFNIAGDSIHYTFFVNPAAVGKVTVKLNASLRSSSTIYARDVARNLTAASNLLTFNVTCGILTTSPAFACYNGSAQSLTLSATGNGTSIKWYDVPVGGTALSTGGTFVTVPLSATKTYYVETTDGTTTSPRVAVEATIYNTPTITTESSERCFPGAVTLTANASAGDVYWYAESVGGTSLSKGSSYKTQDLASTTSFYAEAVNGGCKSISRAEAVVVIKELPSSTSDITGSINVTKGTDVVYTVDKVSDVTYLWSVTGGSVESSANQATVRWLSAGRQIVTVKASNVCGSSSAKSLTVWSNEIMPDVPVLVAPAKDSANSPVNIKLVWNSISNATSYDIQLSSSPSFESVVSSETGNISAVGVTDSFYTFGPLDLGTTYYWRVRALNEVGNTDWSETWSFVTTTATSIETAKNSMFSIFPNPVSNILSIESASVINRVSVYSSDNKLLMSMNAASKSLKTDVSHLDAGIYLLKVETESGASTVKMIKE
jgi:hypothetical protein